MGDLKAGDVQDSRTSSGLRPALVARVIAAQRLNWAATTRLPTSFIDAPMAVPPRVVSLNLSGWAQFQTSFTANTIQAAVGRFVFAKTGVSKIQLLFRRKRWLHGGWCWMEVVISSAICPHGRRSGCHLLQKLRLQPPNRR
jgi:hypothetical protein